MIQQKDYKDYNTCTIFYTKNGTVQKIRAVSHLSGKNTENKKEYVIVIAKKKQLLSNSTNDSLALFLKDSFKQSFIPLEVSFVFMLESLKANMNELQLAIFDQIYQKTEMWQEEKRFISKEAVAFEFLNGRHFEFTEFRIPTANYVRRMIDID